MFSNHRSRNKVLAAFVFIAALLLYTLTLSPTASFWDPGEFIAVAHGLEVNHPPGAPFFELLGRLFSMFMPAAWVAVSVNFISALASALTITLLYLIIVRLVQEFKGIDVDSYRRIDLVALYSGGLIGAFTFAVTDSFWFNAVEAEVYALSMFFTAVVIWLALRWSAEYDKPKNERWLLLIAYMFGIALGVHLLNLLALFFVALIIYFKKRDFAWLSMTIAGGIAVASFLLVYPFTVQMIPTIMESIEKSTYGLIGPVFFIILVALVLGSAIYYTQKHDHRLVNLVLLCYTMILIGYSSYALIFIRSTANPPIDENNPETVQSFINYLERKQYGQTPLLTGHDYDPSTGQISRTKESWFPRRYSISPRHLQQYAKYDSDWDFFVNYQVDHMYIRYFNWNFIGRNSDIQDASWQSGFSKSSHSENPAHNSYFYLPFLLGLFGMLYHFQRDWKRALAVLVLFIMTGFAIIVFLNQTPLQPRERDYAYVGSFFAFAIWIGVGGVGVVDMVKEYLKSNMLAAYGVAGLLFIVVPAQMCYQNYNDHDRSDRYVASDYAYNLLQSVDYGGIVFTNGDNDTFPLWYAQEVEGVRTDVRVVCLSLLNTEWYIKQLRDQWSHQSAPLPISLSNKQINDITTQHYLWQPDTVRIPVNKKLLTGAFDDSSTYREHIGVKTNPHTDVYRENVDFGMPVDSLDNGVAWYYQGRPAPGRDKNGNRRYYTMTQDDVILNILKTNKWLRPVYFASTVSPQSQMNLQKYFRFEGMAYRVVPDRHNNAGRQGWVNTQIATDTYRKFRFRDWSKPGNYLDENIRRILGNYRYGVTNLADTFLKQNQPDSAAKWLSWGEKHIPFNTTYGDNRTILFYAYDYAKAGALDKALKLARGSQKESMQSLKQYMQNFNRIQQQVVTLNDEIRRAQNSSGVEAQQKLQQKIQNFKENRQANTRNVQQALSNLRIIQRIYYMNNQDQKATALGKKINNMTGNQIQFPTSKAESKKQTQ